LSISYLYTLHLPESMPMIQPIRSMDTTYVSSFRHRCLSIGSVCLNSIPLSSIAPRIEPSCVVSTILRVLGPMTSYPGSVRPPRSRDQQIGPSISHRRLPLGGECIVEIAGPTVVANGRSYRIRPTNRCPLFVSLTPLQYLGIRSSSK